MIRLIFKTTIHYPIGGKYFLKKILGPTHDKIKNVTLNLFNRILGRQAFNEHLLNKIFLTSMTGLNISTTAIQVAQPPSSTSSTGSRKYSVPVSARSLKTQHLEFDVKKRIESISSLEKNLSFHYQLF